MNQPELSPQPASLVEYKRLRDPSDETLHLVLDLETASTQSNAAVVSIGACAFTLIVPTILFPEFYGHLHLEECENALLHIDPETIKWWDSQPEEMRKEAFKGPHETTTLATLCDFACWCYDLQKQYKAVRIWGYGANFDPVVLGNCMDAFDVKVPWKYSDVRCARTLLKLMHPNDRLEQPDHLKHHALWDARYEAANLRQCLKWLQATGVNLDEL